MLSSYLSGNLASAVSRWKLSGRRESRSAARAVTVSEAEGPAPAGLCRGCVFSRPASSWDGRCGKTHGG